MSHNDLILHARIEKVFHHTGEGRTIVEYQLLGENDILVMSFWNAGRGYPAHEIRDEIYETAHELRTKFGIFDADGERAWINAQLDYLLGY